jgi:UbiD family decarboxylase
MMTKVRRLRTTYYRDLREYIDFLDEQGKLIRVTETLNKDTEIHPLMRLQFRGLPASERKGWLFENVTDSRGRKFDFPVATCVMAPSRDIYALGMNVTSIEDILPRWDEALANPLPPVMVDEAPCQEIVLTGDDLLRRGGVDMLPVPISTPGFDNGPYLTAAHWVTAHPETGVRNVGNYRAQLKAADRLGCLTAVFQDMGQHWLRARELGIPYLDVAVFLGCTPNLAYTACAKVPSDVEEYAVAGAMADEPIELVQCKTVNMQVPANAEMIIEGRVPTDVTELEGPFGEFTGYMARRSFAEFMNVTAITMRKNPIYLGFVSQFPPSESTVLRSIGREAAVKRYLQVDRGLPGIVDVVHPDETGVWAMQVVKIDQREGGNAQAVIEAMTRKEVDRLLAKILVVVDYDIDPHDFVNLLWAICYRFQPERDTQYAPMIPNNLDYSFWSPWGPLGIVYETLEAKSLIIDATMKWPYPPISLPLQEYMEGALARWKRMGLPELHLNKPWYGYKLDGWTPDDEEEATIALQGRYLETGKKQLTQREHKGEGQQTR